MFLEIVTPEEKVFEGDVDSVTLPGTDGSFQVLNNHAPLISSLRSGNLRFKIKKDEKVMIVSGGTVEVLNNRVIVLAESVIQ